MLEAGGEARPSQHYRANYEGILEPKRASGEGMPA